MLFPITVLGQIKLTGKVIDAVTKQPIPYANLESFKYKAGTQSNQEGIFVLDLVQAKSSDTIKVSCVGYLENAITNVVSTENVIYELTPAVFQLNEVKVGKIKYEEKEIGVLDITGDKIVFFNQLIQRPGLQRAVLIKNDGSSGYIKTLHFFMGKDMYNAPFRVHIYDNFNDSPGNDLLNKSLEFAASKKNAWNSFDISMYNIRMPETGFWVGIEWIANEKFSKPNEPLGKIDGKGRLIKGKSTYTYYGPEIVQKFDSVHGLTYQKILGGNWQKLVGARSDGKGNNFRSVLIDLLIKATIQVAK